jgi:alkyl hydroperoxide reductase subunit AhpC
LKTLQTTTLLSKKLVLRFTSLQPIHISPDKVWHETSPAVGKAQFPLVGDPTHALTRNFDVHIDSEGLALRGTFIINPEGVIKTAEIHSNEIARDVSETLRKLQLHNTQQHIQVKFALQSGKKAHRL